METLISASPEEKALLNLDSTLGAELNKLANKQSSKLSTPLENNAEQIKSSVARLTSNSIDELQGLVAELQKMQEFLKSEVESVQSQIDSALAGINIILETIGPWQSRVSQTPPYGTRSGRGATANVEAALRGLQRAGDPRGAN